MAPPGVDEVPNIACMFVDIHHFTFLANQLDAWELLALLEYTFAVMDCVTGYHGVTKLKTIGDAYMAVCGLP